MTKEDVINEILTNGENPEDFNIEILQDGYRVIPKWDYEQKKIARVEVEYLEANFMYDSMMKDMAIEESNNQQAELMYQLMMNGVL